MFKKEKIQTSCFWKQRKDEKCKLRLLMYKFVFVPFVAVITAFLKKRNVNDIIVHLPEIFFKISNIIVLKSKLIIFVHKIINQILKPHLIFPINVVINSILCMTFALLLIKSSYVLNISWKESSFRFKSSRCWSLHPVYVDLVM